MRIVAGKHRGRRLLAGFPGPQAPGARSTRLTYAAGAATHGRALGRRPMPDGIRSAI